MKTIKINFLVTSLLLVLILTAKSYGKNYTVNEISQVSDMQASLTGGDTVFIRGGVYNITTSLNLWGCTGLPGNPVVITASKGEKVIINGSGLPSGWSHGISICYHTQYVTIENLEIRNVNDGHGISVWLENDDGINRAGITIKNNIIHGCGHHGITVATNDNFSSTIYKIKDIVIENNVIYNNKESGILVQGSSYYPFNIATVYNVLISGNTIYHNVTSHDPSVTSGYPGALSYSRCRKVSISNNFLYENMGEGIVGYLVDSCMLTQNRVRDNFSVNIYLDHFTNGNVEKNLVYTNNKTAYYKNGYPAAGIQNADELVYHATTGQQLTNPSANNVITNNIIIGGRFSLAFMNYDGEGGTNTNWKMNNILLANNTVFGSGESMLYINNASHTNTRFKNNIFYQKSGVAMLMGLSSTSGLSFSNNTWYNGSAGILASGTDINADPKFVNGNISAPDTLPESYRLSATSPCIDKGVELTEVSVDFFGNPRQITDIGASEKISFYQVSIQIEPAGAGTINNIDSVIVGNEINLSVAPGICYLFKEWQNEDNTVISTNSTISISQATRDIVLTAIFDNKPVESDTVAHFLCMGDSIFINSEYIKQSGVYQENILSETGCDSIVLHQVSFAWPDTFFIDTIIKKGDSFDGYEKTGIYKYYKENALSGCNDYVELFLLVVPYDTIFITDTITIYDTALNIINDTVLHFSYDTITTNIYDTTTQVNYDTIKITICDTIYYQYFDTIKTNVFDTSYYVYYDTIRIKTIDSVLCFYYDTLVTIINDTVQYQTFDTIIVHILDTVHFYKFDTISIVIHDSVFHSVYDTVITKIEDTVYYVVYDTITNFKFDTINFVHWDSITITLYDTNRINCYYYDTIKIHRYDTIIVTIIGDKLSGYEAFEEITIHLYPNPANRYIILESGSEMEKVELYSIENKILCNEPVNAKYYQLAIKPAVTTPGIYFLAIYTQNKVIIKKLIVI